MFTTEIQAARVVEAVKRDTFAQPKPERVALLREVARQAGEAAEQLEAAPEER